MDMTEFPAVAAVNAHDKEIGLLIDFLDWLYGTKGAALVDGESLDDAFDHSETWRIRLIQGDRFGLVLEKFGIDRSEYESQREQLCRKIIATAGANGTAVP
jgi:hypothetical protein